MARLYSHAFYAELSMTARRSAREIVPLVLELLHPRSVVDVGCGTGAWLAAFQDYGVPDVLGIDGAHVPPELLEVPANCFLVRDLARPLRLARRFDLVLALEVAEHLPPSRAGAFIESLTGLGPLVLFSAAIPFQGGLHHANEQWPAYWAALFATQGFVPIDCIRPRVWENAHVQWWYAQNTLLYAQWETLANNPALRCAYEASAGRPLNLVHPQRYLGAANLSRLGPRRLLAALPAAVWHSIRRKLGTPCRTVRSGSADPG
jgi:SAM-dependent methyltransferase